MSFKRMAIAVGVLLLLVFIVYASNYRGATSGIYALSLLRQGQTLYVPKHHWQCHDKGACTVRINKGDLRTNVDFQPEDSPFGQCSASYEAHPLTCRVKQRYYYRFGETMRPYLVLVDREDAIPLTRWQVARFRLETILANLALGDELYWSVIVALVALVGGSYAFLAVRKALFQRVGRRASGYSRSFMIATFSLIVSLALVAVIWFSTHFLLFASGVMLD